MDVLVLVLIILGSLVGCCLLCYLAAFCGTRQFTAHGEEAETLSKQVISNLDGKIVLITGATSGIGKETARIFCQSNCTLIFAVRTVSKGTDYMKELASNVHGVTCKATIITERLDLSDLNQIKNEFVAKLESEHNISKIDILCCNAGYLTAKNGEISPNGYDLSFATNHLGHMYLVQLLKPLLDAGGTSSTSGKSRVIVTSSSLHQMVSNAILPTPETVDNIDSDKWKNTYDPNMDGIISGSNAYNWSKLCNIWFVREFEKRYSGEGNIIAVNCHPGVGITGLFYIPGVVKAVFGHLLDNVGQLAFVQTYLACCDESKLKGGEYYIRDDYIRNMKPFTKDESYQAALWTLSEKLINNTTAQA